MPNNNNNIIIRKTKPTTNIIIRKRKLNPTKLPISPKSPKSPKSSKSSQSSQSPHLLNSNSNSNSNSNQSTHIETDFIKEYLETTIADPKLSNSKEDLIEKVKYERDMLMENKNKYSESDYLLKMEKIDKIFSRLRLGLTFENLNEIKDVRNKIDKIVLDNHISKEQFKEKINLTGKCNDPDPNYHLVTESRKYFSQITYEKPPPNIAEKDPKNYSGGFGNQPLPDEWKCINFI